MAVQIRNTMQPTANGCNTVLMIQKTLQSVCCYIIFGLSYALKSKSNLNSNEFVPEDFATETVGAQDQSQISIYCKWLLSFKFSSQFNVVVVFRHPHFFLYKIDVQQFFCFYDRMRLKICNDVAILFKINAYITSDTSSETLCG